MKRSNNWRICRTIKYVHIPLIRNKNLWHLDPLIQFNSQYIELIRHKFSEFSHILSYKYTINDYLLCTLIIHAHKTPTLLNYIFRYSSMDCVVHYAMMYCIMYTWIIIMMMMMIRMMIILSFSYSIVHKSNQFLQFALILLIYTYQCIYSYHLLISSLWIFGFKLTLYIEKI